MSELIDRFEDAVEQSTELARRPDNDTLLELYGLYKQAKQGDVQGERPSSMEFEAAAKFDAWEALAGVSTDEAMRRYVELVEHLKNASG